VQNRCKIGAKSVQNNFMVMVHFSSFFDLWYSTYHAEPSPYLEKPPGENGHFHEVWGENFFFERVEGPIYKNFFVFL